MTISRSPSFRIEVIEQRPRGVWQRLRQDPNPGGAVDLDAWANLALDVARDVVYLVDWSGIIHRFSLADGTVQEEGSFEPNRTGGPHNRTLEYDPLNDRLWWSNGSFGQYTAMSFTYWEVAADVRGNLGDLGGPQAQSAMEYDALGKRLVAWGGWSAIAVKTFSLDPIGSSWDSAGTTGAPPPTSAEADKFTDYKTVWDSRRERWITVSGSPEDGALYILPRDLSAWSKELPGGAEKPPLATWFVYNPAGDEIIGWAGSAATVSGQPVFGEPRTTWRLKLDQTPLSWEKLASASRGDVVPPAWAMIAYTMVWDAVRGRVFLLLENGVNPWEVWVYYPP